MKWLVKCGSLQANVHAGTAAGAMRLALEHCGPGVGLGLLICASHPGDPADPVFALTEVVAAEIGCPIPVELLSEALERWCDDEVA